MLQAADLTIRLHPEDDVVIARLEIPTGTLLTKENVRAIVTIPAGHKIAVRAVTKGQPVRRYNQIIGFATRDIEPGEHVHVHNLAMGDFERDYAYSSLVKKTDFVPQPAIVRRRRSVASPSLAMPQPVLCVSATTPSTLGKSSSRFSKCRAIIRATVAEQFTLVRMPM